MGLLETAGLCIGRMAFRRAELGPFMLMRKGASMRGTHKAWIGLAALLLACSWASWTWAAKITLTDGTAVEGTAIKQGDQYWVKTKDGQTRYIPVSQVKGIDNSAAGDSKSAGPVTPADLVGGSTASTKRRAESSDTAAAAVKIWEEFLKTTKEGAEQDAAKEELARWKALAADKAEKISGKWVGGKEREAIVEQAGKIYKEAMEMFQRNQTIQAQKKLEEALKVYPTSFDINFWLGFMALARDADDEATRYFDVALRKRPECTEAMLNMGIALYRKKQYDRAIDKVYGAAKIEDDFITAIVLLMVTRNAPATVQRGVRAKEAIDSAKLLASKYGLDTNRAPINCAPVPLMKGARQGTPGAGALASGTGFLINDLGLILTNRHVVDGAKELSVVLGTSDKRKATVVVIDDKLDLALIQIKPKENEKLPFVQFSPKDSPGDGAECTVMGYPMIDRLGATIKITRGIVSGTPRKSELGADVLIDAKVNPGNSGGPILDRFGHVMAIVSMKSITTMMEDSYGIGISAGQIRAFLVRHNTTATLASGGDSTPLSTEEIASSTKPATVCILAQH